MPRSERAHSFFVAIVLFAVWGVTAFAQGPARRDAAAGRILGQVNEEQVFTLAGNVHPLARGEFDLGAAPGETALERMVLELEPTEAQQGELDALVAAQHDRHSGLYHQWLTPAEYGLRFGASAADVARVTGWLRGHGFTVDEVPASNRLVIFSGTAVQVEETFHTALHRYKVDGVEHIANVLDPQVPVAFAGVVGGVLSLHDFRRTSEMAWRRPLAARPEYSSGTTHYLFPADWATIYDLNPLYGAGTKGAGVSIAIVGRSNINLSDVASFRSASGLPANTPAVILVSTNPGLIEGDQDESTLDVEWSGAVAPAAAVKFVVGASTATTDGVDLSAQYIVNHATAPVVSTSYGSCETYMGASELSFYNSLWEQAASEGISAFVSSGDSGAAGCDAGSSAKGTLAAVNGLCSSPYSTCVGGTEFNEGSNAAKYWSSTNAANSESALGYIPEEVWNESALDGGSGLWSSTGGASAIYTQPAWQKGVSGTSLANGMRAVPDVAMTAAGHDGYIIVENGSDWVIAGTSAASPSFAGVMALVVESEGGKGQGNANPALYALLNGAKNPFHATPSGNNSVPGVTGFTASGGAFNLATGLGSVDGALLVSAWSGGNGGTTSKDFALTESSASGTAQVGKTVSFTVAVTESGAGKNAVALTGKLPTGVTASISPSSITPGTTATVTLTVGSTAVAGTQNVSITGSDSSGTQTLAYALAVTAPPTLALSVGASTATVAQGATARVSLTATTGGSYSGAISWSVSGLPSGVTGVWSANPMTPAGSVSTNVETLALTASSTAKVESGTVTVTAAGDGLTARGTFTAQVTLAPGIVLAASPGSVSVQSLATAKVTVTATPVGGLTVGGVASSGKNGAREVWVGTQGRPSYPASGVELLPGAFTPIIGLLSGLPTGFTAAWSAPTLTGSGAVVWTLTLTGSGAATAGLSTLSLKAQVSSTTATGYSATMTVPMTVTLTPPALSLTTSSAAAAVVQGKWGTELVTLAGNGTFTGAVSLSVSGLPAGVTAGWSSNPVTLSAESGSSTLTLTAGSTAPVGSTPITVTAKGDGVTATKQITLQVTQAPGLQLALSASTLSMVHTGSSSVMAQTTELGGLNAPVTVTLSGLPAGVTGTLSNVRGGSQSENTTLMLIGSSKAGVGTSVVTVRASAVSNGVTYTAAQTLTLQLK